MYVYIQSERNLWTTGFYKPDGTWEPDNDYNNPTEAAERVAWLNGSGKTQSTPSSASDAARHPNR